MSICVFGDSVAKGVIYDEAKNKYIHLKNSFINMFSQKLNLRVENYARFGCTVTKGIEILSRHKNELSSFSHTLLEFGGNDCDLQWNEISDSPEAEHLPNVPLPQFEEKYLKMIDIVRRTGSVPVMLNLPPLDSERFLKWVSRGQSRENILKFLGDVNAIFKWQESYSIAVKKLAQLHGVRFVDIRSAFMREDSYSDYLCRDGMHPNEKGHALVGRLLSERNFLLSN
ncbi:MAG: SGNH/GDSL hydrolase family protein [Clostridiales bacterium]|nr:SGNH/GDSL hydrolase family protein [Clostridiales bacterium]